MDSWIAALDRMLAACSGRPGRRGTAGGGGTGARVLKQTLRLRWRAQPRRAIQRRLQHGGDAEALLFDPEVEPLPKSIMLDFKRMREIDVPEVMSSIITENAANRGIIIAT